MNLIESLLNKQLDDNEINLSTKEAIEKSFVKSYVLNNPQILAELTNAVIQNQVKELENAQKKNFDLGLNFMAIDELFTTGKVSNLEMNSFKNLLNSRKREQRYDDVIVANLENVELIKK